MSGVAFAVDQQDPLALAEAAHAFVQTDARGGAELAERAIQLARLTRNPEAEVAALHALGFARHELGDPRAVPTLRSAVRLGERHGLARRAALARRPLSICLAYRGQIAAARRELAAACASLDTHELARTEVFRIALLNITGAAPTTMEGSNRAVETLRQKGDTIWEARVLKNRGLLLAERGDVAAAEADLTRARHLYAGLGASDAAFGAELELARISLARGDLPTSLARLDAIDTSAVSPMNTAELELLRAQALTAGRLTGEARHSLDLAQAIWRRAGIDDHEGRLEVVRLTLLAGDPAQAQMIAQRAQRSFAAQRRPGHHARAVGLAIAASITAGSVRRSSLRAGRAAAEILAAAGWASDALRVRLTVARAAIELGSVRIARHELAACSSLLRHGPIYDRIEAWHVEAAIRLAEDDHTGAQRAARNGLRMLEGHRAAIGASDLRASASSLGSELARLGLRIALTEGGPASQFEWAEALRSSALRLAPVTPPASAELREAMIELRQVGAEIGRAEQSERSTRTLVARQGRLETSIRRLSRHAAGADGRSRLSAQPSSFAAALGDRALVEYVELDGHLIALTLVLGRLTRHELGALGPLAEQLAWLRFALTRLAHLRRGAPQRGTLWAGAAASAAAIGEQLIAPLLPVVGDRELVIVPTGSLHELPWATLPGLRGRALAVSPSASTWLALQTPRRRRHRPKVVLVGGPHLRHVRAEIDAVGALYPGATVLSGRAALAGSVLDALDGATVAHLACHGRFRADSPLFSSLELADGTLNAYELQALRRAPELIVLSACDLAVSGTHAGDELLGFAAALLDMGTRSIIASVVPVPDAAAKRLMLGLHRHLIAGASPGVALARAAVALPMRESAINGFVCLGTSTTFQIPRITPAAERS